MSLDLINEILDMLLPAIASIITVLFGLIGASIKAKYDEKVNNEIVNKIIKSTVNYIQQIYKDSEGELKLIKATQVASELLLERGITLSDLELRMLIESAVYGLNQGLTTQTIKKEV